MITERYPEVHFYVGLSIEPDGMLSDKVEHLQESVLTSMVLCCMLAAAAQSPQSRRVSRESPDHLSRTRRLSRESIAGESSSKETESTSSPCLGDAIPDASKPPPASPSAGDRTSPLHSSPLPFRPLGSSKQPRSRQPSNPMIKFGSCQPLIDLARYAVQSPEALHMLLVTLMLRQLHRVSLLVHDANATVDELNGVGAAELIDAIRAAPGLSVPSLDAYASDVDSVETVMLYLAEGVRFDRFVFGEVLSGSLLCPLFEIREAFGQRAAQQLLLVSCLGDLSTDIGQAVHLSASHLSPFDESEAAAKTARGALQMRNAIEMLTLIGHALRATNLLSEPVDDDVESEASCSRDGSFTREGSFKSAASSSPCSSPVLSGTAQRAGSSSNESSFTREGRGEAADKFRGGRGSSPGSVGGIGAFETGGGDGSPGGGGGHAPPAEAAHEAVREFVAQSACLFGGACIKPSSLVAAPSLRGAGEGGSFGSSPRSAASFRSGDMAISVPCVRVCCMLRGRHGSADLVQRAVSGLSSADWDLLRREMAIDHPDAPHRHIVLLEASGVVRECEARAVADATRSRNSSAIWMRAYSSMGPSPSNRRVSREQSEEGREVSTEEELAQQLEDNERVAALTAALGVLAGLYRLGRSAMNFAQRSALVDDERYDQPFELYCGNVLSVVLPQGRTSVAPPVTDAVLAGLGGGAMGGSGGGGGSVHGERAEGGGGGGAAGGAGGGGEQLLRSGKKTSSRLASAPSRGQLATMTANSSFNSLVNLSSPVSSRKSAIAGEGSGQGDAFRTSGEGSRHGPGGASPDDGSFAGANVGALALPSTVERLKAASARFGVLRATPHYGHLTIEAPATYELEAASRGGGAARRGGGGDLHGHSARATPLIGLRPDVTDLPRRLRGQITTELESAVREGVTSALPLVVVSPTGEAFAGSELALVLARALGDLNLLELKVVVSTQHPVRERARLARATLDDLGLHGARVSLGTDRDSSLPPTGITPPVSGQPSVVVESAVPAPETDAKPPVGALLAAVSAPSSDSIVVGPSSSAPDPYGLRLPDELAAEDGYAGPSAMSASGRSVLGAAGALDDGGGGGGASDGAVGDAGGGAGGGAGGPRSGSGGFSSAASVLYDEFMAASTHSITMLVTTCLTDVADFIRAHQTLFASKASRVVLLGTVDATAHAAHGPEGGGARNGSGGEREQRHLLQQQGQGPCRLLLRPLRLQLPLRLRRRLIPLRLRR